MDHLLERITVWAGWILFILVGWAYARLFRGSSAGNLRRMQEALDEGAKQLTDMSERFVEKEEVRRALQSANDKLSIANSQLREQLRAKDADNNTLLKALELSRAANQELVDHMARLATDLKVTRQELHAMGVRVVKMEIELNLR